MHFLSDPKRIGMFVHFIALAQHIVISSK